MTRHTRPLRGFQPLRDLPAVLWLMLLVPVAVAHDLVPAPRWLMFHLLLLGAVTHSILVWSKHFADTLLRAPTTPEQERWHTIRLGLHNAGAVGQWIPALVLMAMGAIAYARVGSATDFGHGAMIPSTHLKDIVFWSTIAFSLTPRPGAKPRTREGQQMRHFRVHAWVSEDDHELVKLEAEAIDDLSFGLGVLAKLHKGARLSFLRRKVNGEVWLPAVVNYSGNARVGLLFMLRRSGTSEFSGYRKYTVDTSSSFNTPK